MGGTDEELREFAALSAKVSNKQASEQERARWRTLRAKLAPHDPKPPAGQPARAHARTSKKLRLSYLPVTEMTVTFTDEIGGGGFRLRAPRHFDVGTELALRLEVGGPTGAHLFTVGRVAWAKREGGHFAIGVELPLLRPEERERLEAFAHAPTT